MKFITTTQNAPWKIANTIPSRPTNTTLSLTGETDQMWEGFGGCFNELSQKALLALDEATRNEVYDLLFSKEADGLKFDFCRLPIGASDLAFCYPWCKTTCVARALLRKCCCLSKPQWRDCANLQEPI